MQAWFDQVIFLRLSRPYRQQVRLQRVAVRIAAMNDGITQRGEDGVIEQWITRLLNSA